MFDKELLNYIKDKKYYLILNVLFNVLAFIFNILITSSILYLIYNTINKLNNHLIDSLISLFIGLLFKIIFTLLANYYSHKLANYVIMKLRIDTYSKYLRLNTNIPFTISEMAELSTEGIEQLRLYYEFYLPSFFYAMIAPILLFMLFLCFDYKVALVYLICIPLIPISIILVSKGAKKIFNKYWDIYLGLGDSFLDNVRGLKELKIFLYDEERTNDMALKSEEFRKITMKVLVMQLYSVTIMDLVAYGGAGLGIVLTLISMQNGLDLYVALFMILIGAEFFLPLRRLGSAFHVAMNGATAGKKVIKLLNEEEKVANILIDNKIDNILIKDLSFNYKDKDLILNNINMQLNIGLYSIVGISGSGKSTIAKILANINNNYKGHIILYY